MNDEYESDLPAEDEADDLDELDDEIPPAIEGADSSLEPRHIHQVVSVRLGASDDMIFVARTEAVLEHSHPLAEPGDDLWDEHARALGMSRPRPLNAAPADVAARPAGRLRGRPPARRELPAPGTGRWISFGSKSRMPAHMTRNQLEAYLRQERQVALEVRDPLAINYAAERYTAISTLLQEISPAPDEPIDLTRPVLSVSQAAKILGYNAKEVRRLLGQGKIAGRKVGSEWRVPLRAVL